jgi:hypothetical protein
MLTSLSAVKAFLEIDSDKTNYDSLLVIIIKQVSDRIQMFLNRKLAKEERTQYFTAGRKTYFLDSFPIDTAASFTVSLDTTVKTINDDYWLWPHSGTIEFNFPPPHIQPRQLSVTYTGGYASTDTAVGIAGISTITETVLLTVPDSMSYACMLQSAFMFRRRKDIGISSISLPDGSFNTLYAADLLPEVKNSLMQYRKVPTDY